MTVTVFRYAVKYCAECRFLFSWPLPPKCPRCTALVPMTYQEALIGHPPPKDAA